MHRERYLILYFNGHLYPFTEKHKNAYKFLLLERYSSSKVYPIANSMILGALFPLFWGLFLFEFILNYFFKSY